MAKVFIQINEKYAIGSDKAARSWTIVKRKGKRWEDIKWFNTLQNAVTTLGEIMLRSSGAQSFGELLVAFENIKYTLSHAIARHFNIELGEIGKASIDDSNEQDR